MNPHRRERRGGHSGRHSGNRVFLREAPGLSLAWASYRSLIADGGSRLPELVGLGKFVVGVWFASGCLVCISNLWWVSGLHVWFAWWWVSGLQVSGLHCSGGCLVCISWWVSGLHGLHCWQICGGNLWWVSGLQFAVCSMVCRFAVVCWFFCLLVSVCFLIRLTARPLSPWRMTLNARCSIGRGALLFQGWRRHGKFSEIPILLQRIRHLVAEINTLTRIWRSSLFQLDHQAGDVVLFRQSAHGVELPLALVGAAVVDADLLDLRLDADQGQPGLHAVGILVFTE